MPHGLGYPITYSIGNRNIKPFLKCTTIQHMTKAVASSKCTVNFGNAFWNHNHLQVSTRKECIISYGSDTRLNNNRHHLGTVIIPRRIPTARIVIHFSSAGNGQHTILRQRPGQVIAASAVSNHCALTREGHNAFGFLRRNFPNGHHCQ